MPHHDARRRVVGAAVRCGRDVDYSSPATAQGLHLSPPQADPPVTVSGTGSGRVSVAGLICFKPGTRSRLLYLVRVHRGRKGERRSMSEADYAGLITAAHAPLAAPVTLIWDNLNTHISAAMCEWIGARADWLTVERLPACAPQLNTAPGARAQMKNSIGNLALDDRSWPFNLCSSATTHLGRAA